MPRLGAIYRCPACRIELVVDARTNKMKIAPIAAAADTRARRLREARKRPK